MILVAEKFMVEKIEMELLDNERDRLLKAFKKQARAPFRFQRYFRFACLCLCFCLCYCECVSLLVFMLFVVFLFVFVFVIRFVLVLVYLC